ncbi:MAG: HAD family hydrolase [Candidatus Omnitrophica bacterium]|nr:HAD family hydrolase [Candidatus Omnitrophota bacterium]
MKIIFLDRDGVINKYPGDTRYVTSKKEFEFLPGSIQGIRKLNENGFKIYVVSNQAGVSKGLYSQKDLDGITGCMIKGLKKNNAFVDAVRYCTHINDDNCTCRKPKPGLLHNIVSEFNLDPKISFFVGDTFTDMKAARAFGAKSVLVLSGKEKISNRENWEFEPDYVFDNLLLAAYYLCEHRG